MEKNVEQYFDVLEPKWTIIQNPCWQWGMETILNIMYGCVIMHKMIINNECDDNLKALFDLGIGPQLRKGFTFATYKQGIKEIET